MKILSLLIFVGIANAQIDLFKQCGGDGYTGPTCCGSGKWCKYINQWWFQCEAGGNDGVQTELYKQCGGQNYYGPTCCGAGRRCKYINQYWAQCEPAGNQPAPAPGPNPAPGPLPSGPAGNRFPFGKFQHGILYDSKFNDDDYRKYDYLAIWLGTIENGNTDFNKWYQGEFIKKCNQLGKIPLFYAYIIAFEARAKKGIQDCDVDPKWNLCHQGAKFIRENRDFLIGRYRHQVQNIAAYLGDRNKPVIFVMEPDFWQYYGDGTQDGGNLDGPFMRRLFDDFAATIRSELPNAIISWDISAWIGEQNMQTWWGFFKDSKYIDFVHTSGGQAHGETAEIKPNELRWSTVSRITGKRIIGDCGYGVAGNAAGNCNVWNYGNKQARINDGVVALSAGIGAKYNPPPSLDRINLP
jgi:hypothetical protein